MKTEAPRDLALNILNRLALKPVPAGDCLDDLFERNKGLDSRDRAFILHLVQGVLRWRLRLDWILEQHTEFSFSKISPDVLNILRLALFQLFFLDRVPESAAVNEAVEQAKRGGRRRISSFVNGILRRICRGKGKIAFPDREEDTVGYLSIYHSYPVWLIKKWIAELGIQDTERLLSAQNRVPGLTIRTNTLILGRAALLRRLTEEGMEGRPTPYSPEGITIGPLREGVHALSSFREGLFQVQDQAAQITSHLLAPRPQDRILDICAGLGGKTTHLAELTGDRAGILALDSNHKKLVGLRQNAERLGIGTISPVAADASRSLVSLFSVRFDRILVDAPCSGLGVIGRHPDLKWNRDEGDIRRFALLQKKILDEAVSVLMKGGRMLYVTCTISSEENEGVVRAVLEENRDLSLEDLKYCAPPWCRDLIDDQGFLRTLPHIHDMDGFFSALLTKK